MESKSPPPTSEQKFHPNTAELHQEYPYGLRTIMELFDIGPAVAFSVMAIATIAITGAITYFFVSAPPTSITISSGPEGSVFQKNALKYADILARSGVRLNVITSTGSLENLKRLNTPSAHVDVAMAQAGIADVLPNAAEIRARIAAGKSKLVSLGSISYQPLLVFYRMPHLQLLSDLKDKRIAIGPTGSGTRAFALKILAVNGIDEKGSTPLLDMDADEAAKGLADGKVDAAFVMSESASSEILHNLLMSSDVHLYNFVQANAYSRKIDSLSVLALPEGSIDFSKNIPPQDVSLVGPMVELVTTKSLHPALSDLLLEAATEVHSHPGVFQHHGEFPQAIEHAIPLSDDASRFYKSGKSFFYRYLPFWIANLMNRIVFVFIPTLVILIPALRSIPAFFRWRTQAKIRRRYKELLAVEKEFRSEKDPAHQDLLRAQFERIEEAVEKMKIRAAFADQFYGLRGHIDYVRGILARSK